MVKRLSEKQDVKLAVYRNMKQVAGKETAKAISVWCTTEGWRTVEVFGPGLFRGFCRLPALLIRPLEHLLVGKESFHRQGRLLGVVGIRPVVP